MALTEERDNIDLRIIDLLQKDSRLSYRKIANALEIAAGTAYNRIKKLEENGVLKSYTVIVDPSKVGYDLTAIITLQAEGAHLLTVESEVAQISNVISVYDITGDYDIAVIARFKDRSDLNEFIKGLLKVPHVKKSVTSVVLNVVKEDFRIELAN